MLKRIFVMFLLSLFILSCNTKPPDSINWGEDPDPGTFDPVDPVDVKDPPAKPDKDVHDMSHQEFIDFVGKMACESMQQTGVPVSVTIAQAILETGWGKYTIQDANNLFGVKGTGPAGSIEVETKECNSTGCYTTKAKFKKYNTIQESIDDHAQIFSLPYYREAMKHKDDPNEFAKQLTGVYATDPNYGSSLISIMKSNNLYSYDSACQK